MAKGLFVIGTDTDVGKTFITAGIVYILRKNNYNAVSFKPVQSGGIICNSKLVSGDIEFIKRVAGLKEEYCSMNSYCLKEAVSPHIAAERENINIDVYRIIDDYQKLKDKYDFIIVEGAGGVIVPLIRNKYYIYDLIKDLNIPVVIVARAGVGTINHTVLTVNYIKSLGINVKGIIINNYSGNFYEDDNIEVIKKITKVDVVGVVNKLDLKGNEDDISKIRQEFEKSLKIQDILNMF
ncbi:dethiobiotin synthase [Caminicella sporogenes]|uniref:dethiobiotin synthase n=1 Tax=Caminicella sporogenes TaxID=166485 RepID=UPI00093225BF|nr:dethiobiotin synthase [Caminicella sporogenes]RKD21594.1 dethiobiotin synthase [Caminicella sporogenes]